MTQVGAALLNAIRCLAGVACLPQIRSPFPDIAHNIVEIVIVLTEFVNRTRELVAIVGGIAIGKLSLPDIQPMLVLGHQLIAPRIQLALLTTATGHFPFSFAGQTFACPLAIGNSIAPRHMHHRMLLQTWPKEGLDRYSYGSGHLELTLQIAVDAMWLAPAHAFYFVPPERIDNAVILVFFLL